MRILKHGNPHILNKLHATLQFHCPVCKCIFEANYKEYSRSQDIANSIDTYITKCPDCSSQVLKHIVNK